MNVRIIETATGRQVPAEIRPARPEDAALWLNWHGQMPADAENGHWQWDQYILLAERLPQQLACFVLVAKGALQGLMLLELKHTNDLGESDIHGLRLSVAPWNRGAERHYKGVGAMLLTRAILLSVEMGFEGRFWLESLPSAEDFYRHMGMIELPERDLESGLRRFKLDAQTARAVLKAREEWLR
jgi:hypothetical protein